MFPFVRSLLALVACLGVLAGAGWLANLAMTAATAAPIQSVTAPVVVDDYTDQGSARLTVLEQVSFVTGGGTRDVPAGTQFVTTAANLDTALSATATAGATLSCAMRVSMAQGRPVIDLLRCAPGHDSPRG